MKPRAGFCFVCFPLSRALPTGRGPGRGRAAQGAPPQDGGRTARPAGLRKVSVGRFRVAAIPPPVGLDPSGPPRGAPLPPASRCRGKGRAPAAVPRPRHPDWGRNLPKRSLEFPLVPRNVAEPSHEAGTRRTAKPGRRLDSPTAAPHLACARRPVRFLTLSSQPDQIFATLVEIFLSFGHP